MSQPPSWPEEIQARVRFLSETGWPAWEITEHLIESGVSEDEAQQYVQPHFGSHKRLGMAVGPDHPDYDPWYDEMAAGWHKDKIPLYHTAPIALRQQIQQEGLRMMHPHAGENEPGVYVEGDPEMAGQYWGEGRKRQPMDMWRIDQQYVKQLMPDYRGQAAYIPHDVPPEALSLHTGSSKHAFSWQRGPVRTQQAKTAAMKPWMPGQYGKGFLSPIGSPVHWQTDGPDGYPDHPTMMNKARYPGGGLPEHYFYVDPSGAVDWYPEGGHREDPEPLYKFLRGNKDFYDKKTPGEGWKPPQERVQWRSARVATEIREWPGLGWEDGFMSRRPVIYNPTDDTVHVGPYSGTHTEILQQAMPEAPRNWRWEENQPMSMGWAGRNPEADSYDYVYRRGNPDEVGWYSMTPRPPARVHQMLDNWSQGKIVPTSKELSHRLGTDEEELARWWEEKSNQWGLRKAPWHLRPEMGQGVDPTDTDANEYNPSGTGNPVVYQGYPHKPQFRGFGFGGDEDSPYAPFPGRYDEGYETPHRLKPDPEATGWDFGIPKQGAMPFEPWEQGATGKGIILPTSQRPLTWKEEEWGGEPSHGWMINRYAPHGEAWPFYVKEDGEAYPAGLTEYPPEWRDWVERDPKLWTVSNSQFKQSAWGLTRDELPPEQQAVWKTKPRSDQFQDFLKNPAPGTRLWRGEQRPTGFTPDQGAGMHWTMMPNAVIVPRTDPGHQPVVWQGTMGENPQNQMFPRDHPMWGGRHRSIDWEGEYRLRPNTQLDLEGYWQPNREDADRSFFPYEDYEGKSPADRGWEFTPVGQRIPIQNSGHLPYSDLFEHGINTVPGHDQLWKQYEQAQRPSDFRVNLDKTDYVMQHAWEGNPWGIGYGGPRPWAKESEDPFETAREFWNY